MQWKLVFLQYWPLGLVNAVETGVEEENAHFFVMLTAGIVQCSGNWCEKNAHFLC